MRTRLTIADWEAIAHTVPHAQRLLSVVLGASQHGDDEAFTLALAQFDEWRSNIEDLRATALRARLEDARAECPF